MAIEAGFVDDPDARRDGARPDEIHERPGVAEIARERRRLIGIRQRKDQRQTPQRRRTRRDGRCRHRQPEGDMEGRTDAGFALDLDVASHRLGKTAYDGKAETGAAKATRRRIVGLDEGLKQPLPLFGGETDAGIGNANAELDLAGMTVSRSVARNVLNSKPDRTRLGEFDRVAQQVEQDLLRRSGSPITRSGTSAAA